MLVWDAGELICMGLSDQGENVSILVVRAMLAVKWLEANAGRNEKEMEVPSAAKYLPKYLPAK